MQKSIYITGTESTDKKITLLSNKEKYTIWIKDKKTGQDSLPYQQFQKIRPISGDTLKAEIWKSPDTFVNQKGETVNYTKRYVNKFILDGEGNPIISPSAPQATVTPQTPTPALSYTPANTGALEAKIRTSFEKRDKAIQELSDRILKQEEQLSYFAFMFQMGNKDAFDTHKDMLPTPKEPPIPVIE